MTEAVGEVLVERDGAVGLLTLNRPAARNSMTPRMIDELGNALGEFRDDSDIAVVVITGAGDRAFCSGMDLRGTPPTQRTPTPSGSP